MVAKLMNIIHFKKLALKKLVWNLKRCSSICALPNKIETLEAISWTSPLIHYNLGVIKISNTKLYAKTFFSEFFYTFWTDIHDFCGIFLQNPNSIKSPSKKVQITLLVLSRGRTHFLSKEKSKVETFRGLKKRPRRKTPPSTSFWGR